MDHKSIFRKYCLKMAQPYEYCWSSAILKEYKLLSMRFKGYGLGELKNPVKLTNNSMNNNKPPSFNWKTAHKFQPCHFSCNRKAIVFSESKWRSIHTRTLNVSTSNLPCFPFLQLWVARQFELAASWFQNSKIELSFFIEIKLLYIEMMETWVFIIISFIIYHVNFL